MGLRSSCMMKKYPTLSVCLKMLLPVFINMLYTQLPMAITDILEGLMLGITHIHDRT